MLKKTLVVVCGAVGAVLSVFVFAELLGVLGIPETSAYADAYWSQPWVGSVFVQHFGLVVHMLSSVWLLWVVGALVFLTVWWGMEGYGSEEVGAYLERIHIVEEQMKDVGEENEVLNFKWNLMQEKLDELFEKTSEVWLIVDKNRGVRRWNNAALAVAQRRGSGVNSLEGKPFSEVVAIEQLEQVFNIVLNEKKSWSGEVFDKGYNQWLMVWAFPYGDDVAMILRDVSVQHRDQGHLQNSEILVRQLVEQSTRPVAILDAEWRYMYVSKMWNSVFGIADGEVLLQRDHRQVMPAFPADVRVIEQQLARGEAVGREEERLVVQGRDVVVAWSLRPWHDAGGRLGGYVFGVNDVTDQVRLRQQVEQAEERENALAYSDALTGLPNRQLFNDRLNMALAQAYRQLGKVALFFLDLDGFKGVNDQMGHDYGDLLLKQVAERLKGCVRQTDTVARLGGDEFTIILNIRDKADAEQVAQKILETIRAPYDLNGKVADKVGTSIGVALYPQDGAMAAELVQKADKSMYAAKQAGKNTYRFSTVELKIQG